MKGKRGGNCNRTACQAPGAVGYHSGTKAWYCINCTREINRMNSADALALYGVNKLIFVPGEITQAERDAMAEFGHTLPE